MDSHTRPAGNGPDDRTAAADPSRRQFLRSSAGAALAAGALAATAGPAWADAPGSPSGRVLVRKDVKDLTRQEKHDYVEAVHRLKRMSSPFSCDLSYYDEITSWHLEVHRCGLYGHMSPVFLPWHRALLLIFEAALAEAAGGPIAVPYWDWTDPSSTAAVLADDFMGPYGAPEDDYAVLSGPFRRGAWEVTVHGPPSDDPAQFTYLVRAAGTSFIAPELPTAADTQAALSRPVYDVAPWDLSSDPEQSFRQYWEGWIGFAGHGVCVDDIMQPTEGSDPSKAALINHNRVHFYVGGMFEPSSAVKVYGEGYLAAKFGVPGAVYGTIVPASAPNDPLFWHLHSNVDRVWARWQECHPDAYRPVTGGPYPQNLDDPFDVLAPYTRYKTVRSVQDIHDLGYRYA
ncbi:tyrosinase [Kitasatospora sp. GP30]|uniref:tyrosinase family protein n=1 Tax=Kitasatospora sp. GP30 TaxID=3035084 RepID=UPI000C704BC6|nr:tyrosinase family protein [Kitasatospora sp. GP30]MDH6143648.1 tyrosinase [Kitasatospora sp. GP30]